MLELMEYDLWIKRTKAGIGKPRSRALKKIDQCLKDFHTRGKTPTQRNNLVLAIDAWKQEKGAGWRNSIRNKNGAVNDLASQAADDFDLSDLDQEALQYLHDARRQFIVQLFQGRQLVLSSRVMTGISVASVGYQTGSVASSVYSMADKLVRSILGKAVSDPLMAQLIQQVLGQSLSDLIKQVAPGVGIAYSSSMATYNGYCALSAARSSHSIANSQAGLLKGDPTAAFLAVKTLIDREVKTRSATAASHGIEATAKGVGIFLDAGAATGTAASLMGTASRLLISLHILKKDWDETQAVKGVFQRPWDIDNSLFAKSPLLGCYFLLSADTWMITNLVCEDFGKPGFKYKVEQAVKNHLNPLMNVAGQCIINHRMKLTGPFPKLTVEREDDLNQLAVRGVKVSDKVTSQVYNFLFNKNRQGHFK